MLSWDKYTKASTCSCLRQERKPSFSAWWSIEIPSRIKAERKCVGVSVVPFIVSLLETNVVTGIKWDFVYTGYFQYIR